MYHPIYFAFDLNELDNTKVETFALYQYLLFHMKSGISETFKFVVILLWHHYERSRNRAACEGAL